MLDFDKMNGLVPAIIQDADTRKVLMLGFMNQEAYEKTLETGLVTFYSRTRQKLWTKGEESGHVLHLVSMAEDCDHDTLLVQVHPDGPCSLRNCRPLLLVALRKCPKDPIQPASSKAA